MTPISPNFGPRKNDARPDILLIHYTAMEDAPSACARLCDPEVEVSAHYLIAADGEVTLLVHEDERAWHAGAGAWGSVTDINSRSIGIELDNDAYSPFPEAQMRALIKLTRDITTRWSIPPARVLGHSDTAPGRKIDPGLRFDWRRLARHGLALWPGDLAAQDPAALPDLLERAGYTSDASLEEKVQALRARFRPGATGPADAQDAAIAQWLAADYPAI